MNCPNCNKEHEVKDIEDFCSEECKDYFYYIVYTVADNE